jgi:hypothetical protein
VRGLSGPIRPARASPQHRFLPLFLGAGLLGLVLPEVRSKKGGLKFSLDAGPKGMAVSPQGELTWAVPADHPPGEENVSVTARDAAGREVFHTYRLLVPGAAEGGKR